MESLSGCRVHNAAALFFYRHDSPYCEIVRQFKYGRRESLGLWAARLLGGYLAAGGLYCDVQAVVPVPLHPLKRWKRGFNQAEIIARGVAEGLGGILVVPHLLRRRRYTSTQTRRSAISRRSNVSGAFAVNPRELGKLRVAGITHILIVDDVLTTGATLSECIRLLQDHFTVSAATLGFVE
jgi:ComF family protein